MKREMERGTVEIEENVGGGSGEAKQWLNGEVRRRSTAVDGKAIKKNRTARKCAPKRSGTVGEEEMNMKN
ncbi:hypothetical protein AXF42_Ash013321 [Apostasia shenzhenica]|uniref:Uncharacterized protein n=1 Tax=Apostasia shenzhenica TaxID=1088818 RepID=A0A2I0BBN6_9ASPA|nr:hypothetical protein AXF42_Ash013321 [Apostasia shenzhenica]